ncbi:hypothetical protein PF010_g21837 [Phytophthora fragariae]|uniref:Crinkler effector protein N-terminal domain-containing protein n=2 Tax=Phytophthora fragariae TaxID=53985 RepID=A0A6A3QNS2_9STRA|nr:hypothetical protein PF011_g18946 [Phytophthora fragariae]KAE9080188.1 hypothetical protein PF007_g23149 [Phytophthora fragariae]KAE9081824.1 hypothetical protein PF010_g21837 [Phytophthora fragariae]KAE9105565.1 hypothetical protein PF006_g21615 [Phytophthora fragariae]KAE9217388.1 hypothetical protein PF004_g14166 [Phytophthora fragariae]
MAEEEMKSEAARMATVACVLVGVKGTAFAVDIDLDRSLSHLKDEIKEKNPQSIQCEARGLKLALARRKNSRDDPWLHSDEPIVMEMQSGVIPGEVKDLFKEEFKDPIKTIRDVFGDDTPTKGRIHLLVKLPAYKRQIPPVAISWTATAGAFPSLTFNDSHFIRIPERYVRGSGVGAKGKDLLLYRRPQLIEEFGALQRYVIDAPSLLWIMGPPGTGKSCAAFAFACSLDRSEGLDVLWIHFPKVPGVLLQCIRFSRLGDKHTSSVEADELHAVLLSLKKTAIVFLDGYMANRTKDADAVLEVCAKWRNKNKACHRLVCVCLMVSSGLSWHQECYEFIS